MFYGLLIESGKSWGRNQKSLERFPFSRVKKKGKDIFFLVSFSILIIKEFRLITDYVVTKHLCDFECCQLFFFFRDKTIRQKKNEMTVLWNERW